VFFAARQGQRWVIVRAGETGRCDHFVFAATELRHGLLDAVKTLVAVTFRDDAPETERRRVLGRVRNLVASAAGGDPEVLILEHAPGQESAPSLFVVVAGRDAADVYEPSSGRLAILLARECYMVDNERLTGGKFLANLAADYDHALRYAAPPFAACFRRGPDAPLELATDLCGLRHVYSIETPHWAAASSSSLALGALAEAPIDQAAYGNFALVGNFMARRTPFVGVQKVEHCECIRLAHGGIERYRYRRGDFDLEGNETSDLVQDGARTLRSLVRAAVETHDEPPTLELSGGIDSRALLAAFTPAERKGLRGLTLGTPTSPDWIVAERLARQHGLAHQTVNLEDLDRLSPEEADALVRRAALRNDCTSGAVATGVLIWVESQVEQGPRFNGINGEYGRGRFYAAQPSRSTFTDKHVEQLARWRIFANDAVDPALFQNGFIEDARSETIRMLQDEFRSYDAPWLRTTDDHFLYGRMQRWTGIEFSASCMERPILAPFFCLPFLAWSCRLDEQQKRGSKYFSAVIEDLDPELARVRLVTGFSPHDLAGRSLTTRARLTAQSGRRIARKARQRLRPGTDTPPAGAERLARLVRSHWSEHPEALDSLGKLEMLDMTMVEAFARGDRAASAASVGFLTDLLVLTQALQDATAS
jgi:asparagine synthase (glutamine-hydrolysing)